MMGTGSCCCGPSDPICLAKITESDCDVIQQFISLVVTAGPYTGTYLLYCGVGGATRTFTRLNTSGGISVTLVILAPSGGFHDVQSLVVTDGSTPWSPTSCSEFSADIIGGYRCYSTSELAASSFTVDFSGASASTCCPELNETVSCPIFTSPTGIDGYILGGYHVPEWRLLVSPSTCNAAYDRRTRFFMSATDTLVTKAILQRVPPATIRGYTADTLNQCSSTPSAEAIAIRTRDPFSKMTITSWATPGAGTGCGAGPFPFTVTED